MPAKKIDVEVVRLMTAEGKTIREIATAIGVCHSTVGYCRKRYGMKTKNRGGQKPKEIDIEAVREMLANGKGVCWIAARLNIPKETIRRACKRHNLPMVVRKANTRINEDAVAQMRTQGKTNTEMAAALGATNSGVRRVLSRLGMTSVIEQPRKLNVETVRSMAADGASDSEIADFFSATRSAVYQMRSYYGIPASQKQIRLTPLVKCLNCHLPLVPPRKRFCSKRCKQAIKNRRRSNPGLSMLKAMADIYAIASNSQGETNDHAGSVDTNGRPEAPIDGRPEARTGPRSEPVGGGTEPCRGGVA